MNIIFYIISLIVLSPLIALGIQSFASISDTFLFLFANVLDDVVLNSLIIMTLTGVGVFTMGVSCAWLCVHYHFPCRKSLQWMLCMPLAFPAYILAYIYTDFFDSAGTLAASLRQSGFDELLPDMRSLWGASFILTFCLYPYVYLFAHNGFSSGSKSQIENGKLLGSNALSRFFDIALPSARPFILVGLMLVIMEVLADYGVMNYFGIRVFSTVIYDSWAAYGDLTAAAQLSMVLMSFALILTWAEKIQRHHMRFYALDGSAKTTVPRAKGSIFMTLWCAIPVTIGFIAPVGLLIHMTFDNFEMGHVIQTLPYLYNTLTLCALVAFIGVTLSYIMAAQKRVQNNKTINILYNLCGFGYALPGIIVGLGLLLVSSLFSSLSILATGTFVFLILGYLIRFLNVSLQGLDAGYEKISPSLEQASKLLQHSKFDDFWQIKLPILAPALFSTALILSVEVIKELPITLVLRPFDFDTLAVRTYNLASDERLAEASLPALFIVLAGFVPVMLLQKIFNARR